MKKMSFEKMATKMSLVGGRDNISKSGSHVTLYPMNYVENKSSGLVTLGNFIEYIFWR